MSLKQNIYGSLFVSNNITGNTLNLTTINENNSLTQLLVRDNSDGVINYRDVSSVISAATSADTFVTGFTYDGSNTFSIIDNSGNTFNATINTVTGLTSNGDVEVIGNLIVTGGTGNVLTKQVYVEDNLGLDWDFPSSSVVLGNNSDGTIINGTNLTINSDTTINGNLSATTISATTYFGDGSNLTGIDNFYVSGGTYNVGTNNINFSGNNVVTTFDVDLSTLISSVSGDTFVTGGTYDNGTDIITFTNNSGGTFDVTGITDNFVIAGSYSDSTDTISLLRQDGSFVNITGVTDNFVSGGTYNSGTNEINFVGNSSETTFDVDLSSLISSVSGDTFVISGNADVATSLLTFTNNSGGTFNVTNSAALFSDNDINVTGGTYDNNTGCVTFTTNSGTTFDVCGFVTGLTDTFTTGSTLVGETIQFDSNILGPNYYNVSLSPLLSGKTDNSTFNSYTSNTETILNSKVSGATNLSTTGLFAQKNVDNLEFKGLTSTGDTVTITNDSTTVNLEVVGGTDTNSFSTGGTITQSATSGDSEVIVQIVGNSGFTPYNITGLTDTFINDFSISSNTFTISQNDGSSFVATADTIDLASVLSAVTFDIGTSGSISATTFNGGTFNGTFVGDGSGLTGITDNDTFVTGTTFASNQITLTRNDNVDVFSLSGGSNVTLSETATNDILIDVSLPPSMNTFVTGGTYNESTDTITLTRNDAVTVDITGVTDTFTTGATYDNGTALATFTKNDGTTYTLDLSTIDVNDTFVTGFTYNDNNTFTITRNDGVDLNTSINTVSALTVTNYIDYTTGTKPSAISGRTYFDRDENALSYFPETPANDVTINIGQESVIRVHNNTGVQINNGEVCHISSDLPSVNGVPSVVLAIATGSTTTGSRYLVSGVATHDIPNGTEGFITSFGLVRDLNITGVTEGTEIYLSETTPGAFRYTAPDTEFRRSVVGYVVTTGATTGKILVEISNEVGFSELSESLLSVVTENNASTGTRDGGEITINGGDNTLFDISSGSGIIVDNYTDANNPTITNVVWGNITGNTVTNLTADTGSYIFLNSSLNTVQFGISNPPTEADYRDNIYLGILGHANFTNLINVFNTPIQIVSPINQHQDLTSAIGPFSIAGNRILNISGTLELEKTAGRSFFYGGNFHTDNKVPSNITTSDLSGSTLIYATGANVLGPSGTTIDPNNYDPNGAGTITAVPGTNQYVAHRIWHQPSSNLIIFQYGQAFYPNAATARDEFEFENYVVPAGLNETSYLVAIIIAQDGDTDLDSATIIPQGKFAGTGGGGGSVADTLQTAYDNSSSPEIVTDPTRGAVDFRVGSGSDSDNVVTFQQNSGTINAFVEGTGDAKFTNLTGTSVTSNSAINVFNGHINIRDNSYFLQGRTVADVNVSLIGVDNQDRVFVGNSGYDTYIDSDTIVDGVLSAQTTFLTTTPTLNNSATDILVRNSGTGEVEYRPVSGITPDTNTFVISGTYVDSTDTLALLRNDGNFVNVTGITDTFVTGSTVSANTLTLTRNDLQDVLLLSGGTNAQFIDNGNNSITLNVTSGGGGGASVSFPWKFKEPTASSDPGSGQFRLNNTVASAITEIYVSDETNNSIDSSNLLNILDVGDVIYIQQNDDASRALLFTVSASTVDNTGWFTIPVQYQQGSTIPKKDKICGWIFASTGAEDNTVSNVGVGQGVFKQKNVNDFEFYSLSGGSNTTLTLNNDTIVIDVSSSSSSLSVVSVTGSTYSATTSDDVIGFDTSSVTPTLFLPDSTSSGTKRYEVKDIGVNSRRNPITIQAAGSDTIITTSVVSSFELSADGGAVILVSTGDGQWWQM